MTDGNATRARRLAGGLCIDCGKAPPSDGTQRCDGCAATGAARYRAWRNRERDDRPAPRCIECGAGMPEGECFLCS